MGIRGHSKNSIRDAQAVRIVDLKLLKNQTIACDFRVNDTWPNEDGRFELYNPQTTEPKKSFCVQIKGTETLPRLKDGTFSYQADTAIFEYTKLKVTGDPTIVFVVERSTEKIFWKYLSDEYLISLDFEGKDSITLHFDKNEELIDIDDFTEKMMKIAKSINKVLINKTSEQIAEIQDALDWLNSNLNKMLTIKENLFPNLWRFKVAQSVGFLSLKTLDSGITIASGKVNAFELAHQYKGENSSGIEEFTGAGIRQSWDFTGKSTPMDYVKGTMEDFLDKYFNERVPDMRYMPELILHEIVYSFLDDVSASFSKYASRNRCGTYLRDEEQIEFIQKEILPDRRHSLCDAAIIELNNRKISTVKRVWNYGRIGESYDFPKQTMWSIYSKNDLENSIHKSFSNLGELYDDYYNKIFETQEFKRSFSTRYRIEYDEGNIFPYFMDSITVKTAENKIEILQDPLVDINSKEECDSIRCTEALNIELVQTKMPLFFLLKMLTYQGICFKLGMRCRGIRIIHHRINFFY